MLVCERACARAHTRFFPGVAAVWPVRAQHPSTSFLERPSRGGVTEVATDIKMAFSAILSRCYHFWPILCQKKVTIIHAQLYLYLLNQDHIQNRRSMLSGVWLLDKPGCWKGDVCGQDSVQCPGVSSACAPPNFWSGILAHLYPQQAFFSCWSCSS